jgi:hypothetical protein
MYSSARSKVSGDANVIQGPSGVLPSRLSASRHARVRPRHPDFPRFGQVAHGGLAHVAERIRPATDIADSACILQRVVIRSPCGRGIPNRQDS